MFEIRKNKVIQNYLYNLSYQIVITVLPIITTPYLTRVLGADNLGIARYVESIATLFTIIGLLGMLWYADRAIAYNRHNKQEISRCFWEIFILRIVLLVVTLIVYAIFFNGIEYQKYFKIYAFYIVGTFLDVSWLFTGLEEMKPVVVRNYIVRIIFTILLFVCIHSKQDLNAYIWIMSLMTFASGALILPWIRNYVSLVPLKQIHFMRHLLPALALFLPQAASQLYVQCDTVMIKAMLPDVAYVSYYTENEKIAKLPIILATALSTVLMPRIAYEFSKGKNNEVKSYIEKALFSTILVLLPCCTGLIAVARNFVPFFLGKEFADTFRILMILCPAMVFIGISNVTGIQYLVAVNKNRELTISYVVALIANLCINYMLIPRFGVYGAAVGTLVAEGLSMSVQYYYMHKYIGKTLDVILVFKLFILSVLMGGIVYCINYLNMGYLAKMFVQVIVGVLIYGIGVWGMLRHRRRSE